MNELTGVAAPVAFGANASMPYGDDASVKTYVVPAAGPLGVGVGVGVADAVAVAVAVAVGIVLGVGVGVAIVASGVTLPPPQLASTSTPKNTPNAPRALQNLRFFIAILTKIDLQITLQLHSLNHVSSTIFA
ncbi:MAG: hypothetical protein ACYDHD_03380 [Vulcanimicrobiaceae bacterium]